MLLPAYRLSRTTLILYLGLLISCSQQIKFDKIITIRIEKKDFIDIVTVPGTLEAIHTRSYGVPGIWADCTILYLIPEGTHVTAGDRLCILEAREIENNYLQAINELENARAEYNKSVADLKLQYLLLEAQVKTIDASTEITRLDSVQMKFTSPPDREIIRLELEKAELERNITLKKLEFLKQINESELQKMKLKIEQQENKVNRAKSKLDKLTLTSDIEGIVVYQKLWRSEKKVREGDVVWGMLPIIEIPDLRGMQVKLEVGEADYKRLVNDQTMEIIVDAFPDIKLSGKIKHKAPVGKPVKDKSEVKVFEVTASLDSSALSIQPGLGVTCDIIVKSVQDTIVVPIVSLYDEDSLTVVYIADHNMFVRKTVNVTDHNNKESIIIQGLSGGEILALMKPPESLISNMNPK